MHTNVDDILLATFQIGKETEFSYNGATELENIHVVSQQTARIFLRARGCIWVCVFEKNTISVKPTLDRARGRLNAKTSCKWQGKVQHRSLIHEEE